MNESDVDRAFSTLSLLSQTCTAAIDALQHPSSSQLPLPSGVPSLVVLRKDFISLLTLVYTSTTKVTLVLRPSEPAYAAAVAPTHELATHISSLTTCATLFDPHGATLATEVRLAAREVCESVRALASSFLENSGEGYLIRTGSVHEIVENARRELSVDNSAAVRRRLTLDREILEDALGEVSGMIQGTDDVGDEGEDDFEDEWNELGLGSNKKMSEAELDRTKKIQPLVRFVALLQKRIALDILSSLPSRPPSSAPINDTLDSLPAHSHALVLAMEEVIASLYAPQDVSVIIFAVSALADAIEHLRGVLVVDALLPPAREDTDALARGVGSMRISGEGGTLAPAKRREEKDVRKWFNTCFAQIEKLSKTIIKMLSEDSTNAT